MRDHTGVTWGNSIILAAAAGGTLTAALRGHSPIDPGFVSMRYAAHLGANEGLVFNLGERVEGFGDPLWTVLLGLLSALGWAPMSAATVLGVGSLGLLIVLVGWVGTRLLGEAPGAVAALMVAAWPPMAVAARSYDDVLFVAVLLMWAVGLTVAEEADGSRSGWTGPALCLTALTGLLGAGIALLLVGLGAWRRPGHAGRMVKLVGLLLGLTAARWAYFGDPLPNYLRAMAWGGDGRWADGGAWLLQLGLEAPALAGVGLLGTLWALVRRSVWRGVAVVVLVAGVLIVGAAPARVLLWHPLVPVVGLLALLGVGLLTALVHAPLPSRLALVLLLLGFGAQDFRVAQSRAIKVDQARRGRFVQARALGRFLELRFPDGALLAMHKPGVIGMFTDNPIIDLSGRADPAIARAPRRNLREPGKPTRSDIPGAMARDPAIFVHPRSLTGARPGRIRIPPWYPDEFDQHYASVALSARRGWGLAVAHPVWLFFFLRSGLEPAPDWLKKQGMDLKPTVEAR